MSSCTPVDPLSIEQPVYDAENAQIANLWASLGPKSAFLSGAVSLTTTPAGDSYQHAYPISTLNGAQILSGLQSVWVPLKSDVKGHHSEELYSFASINALEVAILADLAAQMSGYSPEGSALLTSISVPVTGILFQTSANIQAYVAFSFKNVTVNGVVNTLVTADFLVTLKES